MFPADFSAADQARLTAAQGESRSSMKSIRR